MNVNTSFSSILTIALVNDENNLLALRCFGSKSSMNVNTSCSIILTTALVNAENSLMSGVSQM